MSEDRQPYTLLWRDRIAYWLANLAMRLASTTYRDFVAGATRYGLDAAARDAREGRDLPPRWDTTPSAPSLPGGGAE